MARLAVWILIVDWILLILRFTFKPHEITPLRIVPAMILTVGFLAHDQYSQWVERKRLATLSAFD